MGYELQPNGYKQLSESDMSSMWKWTRPAVWTQPQCISLNTWEGFIDRIHPDITYTLHVWIANQTQFWNFIFKQILVFYTSSTIFISPHLFGSLSMLLDLYEHTAKCAMKHQFVRASRAWDASKIATPPLEDNSISLHLFPYKQYPPKQLLILILPSFPFLSRLSPSYFTHRCKWKTVLTLTTVLTLHWSSFNLPCWRFVPG